jgi:hypothetical protein
VSTTLAFKYRIIYEALSRFSSVLSRSTTLEQVKQCLQGQVKYLFDYQLIRFSFYQQGYYIIYSLVPARCTLECGDLTLLWPHEHVLKETSLPAIVDDQSIIDDSLLASPGLFVGKPTQRWGWHVGFTPDSGLIVSVFSGKDRQFQPTDVPILKIAMENLHAKILSIRLIEELGNNKKELEQALLGLQDRNEVIARLVSTQEEVILSRTQEVELKNRKLLALSRQHAHTIREPLARILSLAYLIEIVSPEEVVAEIIPMLVTTANDLDRSLQEVIHSIDTDIISTS